MTAYRIHLIAPGRREISFDCSDDETILNRADKIGFELPYACRNGTCISCVGRLKSGEVDQSEQMSLNDDQIQRGFVCLCVAYPRSDCIIYTEQEKLLDGLTAWDLYDYYQEGTGKTRTLDDLAMTQRVRKLVVTPNTLGKKNGRSVQGDFINQVLGGSRDFRNAYPGGLLAGYREC